MTHPYIQYIERGLNAYVNTAFKSKERYINQFFGYNCAGDLLNLGVFPDAKEITESMAMYTCLKKKLHMDTSDPNITVHVVGDGSTPRTGALLAFLTNWKIYSIDPQLKLKWVDQISIRRLFCFNNKVEAMIQLPYRPTIVVLCHAHVPYTVITQIYPDTPMVVMPCCVPYPREKASMTYIDHGVWSPMNEILVYTGTSEENLEL